MPKPFFSVVMPTYNRASVLPLAVKSVLQQTFKDFELVISNSASTDNTKEVVSRFNDPRIRYLETDTRLAIGENYENALNNARGEYITFLSDDDAYVPVMFEKMEKIIHETKAEMITYQLARYYNGATREFNRQIAHNTLLLLSEFTGELTELSSRQALEQLFREHHLNRLPKNERYISSYLANAVYHHSVFERIRLKTKEMFSISPVDIYMEAMTFGVVKSYFCLDEPLLVWNRWTGTTTTTTSRKNKAFKEHFQNMLGGKELSYVPLKFALPVNCAINALLQAKDELGSSLDYIKPNWTEYFVKTYDNLIDLKSEGIDVSEEMKEFKETLSSQPEDIRESVSLAIKSPRTIVKEKLKNNFPALARIIKNFSVKDEQNGIIEIRGEQAGFNNILEAAEFLGKMPTTNETWN